MVFQTVFDDIEQHRFFGIGWYWLVWEVWYWVLSIGWMGKKCFWRAVPQALSHEL